MGWTHHWKRGTELCEQAFALAARDFGMMIPLVAVPLAGFNGTGQPVIRDDAIEFNGVGRKGLEPFVIHRVEFDRRGRSVFWSFCKTEHAPYDLAVQVALIILKHHLGNAFEVCSDGTDEDWADARRLCSQHLGYGDDFQLTHE